MHTFWSTPWHSRCTWPRPSCRASRSPGRGGRQGWGHITGSRWRGGPWRLWGRGTTGTSGCQDRWRHWSWCWDGKYGSWRWTWGAWRGSQLGSLYWGKILRLERREMRGRVWREFLSYWPSNGESGGPRIVACQWKASSPTGPGHEVNSREQFKLKLKVGMFANTNSLCKLQWLLTFLLNIGPEDRSWCLLILYWYVSEPFFIFSLLSRRMISQIVRM